MRIRKLRDVEMSEVGYGCMGFSYGYGAPPPKEEAIRMDYEMGYTHSGFKILSFNAKEPFAAAGGVCGIGVAAKALAGDTGVDSPGEKAVFHLAYGFAGVIG